VPKNLDSIIEGLHPAQQEGLSIEGEDIASSPSGPTSSDLIGHMKGKDTGRLPAIRFVAEADPSEIWSLGDDRIVGGVDVTVTPEMSKAIQAGYICLRCNEPHDEPFPIACSLCGYSMKEFQVRDYALEFKGDKHLGPSKPISEYLDEMEVEAEKKRFLKKIAGGASRMTGLRGRR